MYLTKRFNVVAFDLFLVSFLAQRDLCMLCCIGSIELLINRDVFTKMCYA